MLAEPAVPVYDGGRPKGETTVQQPIHDFVEVLCCPVTRAPLAVMADPELRELNRAIERGGAALASGAERPEPLEAGLAAADGVSFYRVENGVPALVPAERIVVGGSAPAAIAPTLADGAWAAYWEALAPRWNDLRPPRRPAPEDTALLETAVAGVTAAAGRSGPRALLLGVTPEIATMRWPSRTRLLALDASAPMIRHVWPAPKVPTAAVVRANWAAMPVRDGACDVVVGDASVAAQPYPDGFSMVAGEIRRVLRPGGVLATRAFTRPERRESIETIFADLRAGRVATLDAVRWRLCAALHGDRASGIAMGTIWDAWAANVPDPRGLMRDLGWPEDAARVMENLRGGKAVLVFPTLSELRASLAGMFDEIACEVPAYEDGERYPTLVVRAAPRA